MVLKITSELLVSKRLKFKFNWIKTVSFHNLADDIPGTSLFQIRKVFRLKNLTIQEGHACIAINCPICKPRKPTEFNAFVNKATGYFMCQNCCHTGTWDNLTQFLDAKKPDDMKKLKGSFRIEDNFKDKWNEIKRNCLDFCGISENDCSDIINKYGLPSVSKGHLEQLNCHYDKSSSKLYFPLTGLGNKISGLKSLSLHPELTESTIPRINAHGVIIYREKKIKNDSNAVVVPSIEDLLAVISEKAANVVICLPYNLQHMPLQILPLLEPYKKLILWFGNDTASWDSARHYSKKLNEKRCFFVRPTNQQPRPKEAAAKGYNLKSIIAGAQPIWHKSITTFNTLREDVLSDLQNIDKVQGVKWTRYPTLNRVLKGHRRGEFTVFTGPTGSGKTTFMSEYSLDLAMQGVNTLWGSFEIRNATLARTMLQQLAGVPLDKNIQSFDVFADVFEKLPIYFMTFHGQQNIDVVMEAVEHATYVHDIAHVIIDNVQFMMGITEQSKHIDRYWRQDMIVSQFRSFATKNNCHVTLVIHPRKERAEEELTTASIFGGAKASQEADNILIIQDKRLTSVRGKKYLQIAKNRYSGDLGVMNLEFDRNSLSYQQKKRAKPQETSKESEEN